MKRIYLFSYLLVAVFALSCKAVDYSETPPAPDSQFVTADDQLLIDRGLKVLQLSDAERVAQRFMLKDTKKMFSVSAATRADHLTAVRDSAGNPVMYVVNFEQGGFCVVSATKKAYPILAHSDEGFFDLEKVDQSGVCIWLDEMVYGITHRDTLSEQERIFVNSAWAEYEKGFDLSQTRAFGDMNDPRYKAFIDRLNSHYDADARDGQPLYYMQGELPAEVYSHFHSIASSYGCPDEYAIVETIDQSINQRVGPNLKTHWHQWSPYNKSVPNNCPAGCVAIAMAQMMKYYEHPSFFDWASMDDIYHPNLANFIYHVGRSAKMTYESDGAFSNITLAKLAFEKNYGYRVERTAYNTYTFNIQHEISMHGVVYARGNTVDGVVGIFPVDGHAWVYDGYAYRSEAKKYLLECQTYKNGEYIYVTDSRGNYLYNSPYSFSETHANWGWGASDNGWYGGMPTQANSEESDYKYGREFLVITPIR